MSINLLQYPNTAPEKPRWGDPCNGCGLCCASETCRIARQFMGAMVAPCPAMEFEGGRFWCGLVRTPHKYLAETHPWIDDSIRSSFMLVLGVGRGCDSEDPSPAPSRAPNPPPAVPAPTFPPTLTAGEAR
jgi:hypothetical protein